MKKLDTIFHFKGYGNCDSRCRIRIYEGHGFDRNMTVVVATQLNGGDVGTSVTNAAEIIATQVCREHNISPNRLIWIEQYEPLREGVNIRVSADFGETLDRVTFDVLPKAVGFNARALQLAHAKWVHQIERDTIAAIIGEEL